LLSFKGLNEFVYAKSMNRVYQSVHGAVGLNDVRCMSSSAKCLFQFHFYREQEFDD